jgi:signal transduction histidine kinase
LVSLFLSALLFGFHYRLLNRELHERRDAENQLRQLSLQLMRVQDGERRRIARELHDGLGQNLVGAKMMVDDLVARNPEDSLVTELAAVIDDAASQTRTLSYLFHPPLLDEVGFSSAAKWLIDGYAQRTGVVVSADLSRPKERLPQGLELTLYRVLQESLNNIHRHSRSAKAEVRVHTDPEWVTLSVRDFGRGIPSDALAAFRANAPQGGVGLTGMKERLREQGGDLAIRSDGTGTEIIARIPLNGYVEASTFTSNGSVLRQE